MPPVRGGDAPTLVPGPDVIVGDLPSLEQFGSAGTQVGLAVGTDSCNNGDQPIDWFSLPDNDHPVVPQNLYRMSANTDRLEQIGQSSVKHTFFALEDTVCGACNSSGCDTGIHLCPGCSDPYDASLNAGPTWVRAHGSILSPVSSLRTLTRTTTPATCTTAYHTESLLRSMI